MLGARHEKNPTQTSCVFGIGGHDDYEEQSKRAYDTGIKITVNN
jgi:hypothetical protein